MQKKRILLYEPWGRLKHVAKIRDLFLSFPDWEVKKLGPGDTHKHPNCCVILPDTKGINANHSAFHQGGDCIPPNVPPQDQLMQYFLLNTVGHYMHSKIGVCGIGHTGFAIFAELLRGKLAVDNKGLLATGNIHEKAYWKDDEHFVASKPLCAGYTGTTLDEDFVVFVEEAFFSDKEKVPVMVENNPPVPPKSSLKAW